MPTGILASLRDISSFCHHPLMPSKAKRKLLEFSDVPRSKTGSLL